MCPGLHLLRESTVHKIAEPCLSKIRLTGQKRCQLLDTCDGKSSCKQSSQAFDLQKALTPLHAVALKAR